MAGVEALAGVAEEAVGDAAAVTAEALAKAGGHGGIGLGVETGRAEGDGCDGGRERVGGICRFLGDCCQAVEGGQVPWVSDQSAVVEVLDALQDAAGEVLAGADALDESAQTCRVEGHLGGGDLFLEGEEIGSQSAEFGDLLGEVDFLGREFVGRGRPRSWGGVQSVSRVEWHRVEAGVLLCARPGRCGLRRGGRAWRR
jgi:hypothetical protein